MKILSGNFLSQILDLFKRANLQQLENSDIVAELLRTCENQTIQVELEDKFLKSASTIDGSIIQKQRQLDTESLETLNCLLPWSSYNKLDGSMIIGSAYTSHKRSAPHRIPDKHINVLQEYCGDLSECSAIEFGCFEGHYTASLATICKKVYGLDSRLENVIKTLVRCWFLGLEDKVFLDLINLETDSLVNFYQTRYELETIDLAHHRGVLYHLSDPIAHLIDVSNLCNKYLYLHTQYATPEQATSGQSSIKL
jgi:tRNA (mo5U34)-methyltransferase